MTGLNHAVTGALVAAAIDKPAIALPAALLSHFATDAIPHWNYKVPGGLRRRQAIMIVDLILTLWLLFVLTLVVNASPWLIVAGGLLAVLPDTMWLRFFVIGKPSITGSRKRLINRLRCFHGWIQWCETTWGIYVEAAWFVLMVFLIINIRH